MLNELLSLLQEGGTRRISALARRLDTTPELVEAMLEDLVRMGRLTKSSAECADRCSSCALAPRCAAGARSEVWSLIDRPEG